MKIYPVFIPHAGCPHRCLFCAQDRSTSHCSVPGIESVKSWLDVSLPSSGDGEVAFYGGTFTLLPEQQQERFLAAAKDFVDAGRVAGLRLSTRPDALDDSCLERLLAFGVTTIEIGCQSFSDPVLTAAGRGHVSAENVAAVRRCLDAGFQVGIQLMPGLPGGDSEEAMRSLQQAIALKPSFLRIYPTVVIEDTALAALWKAGEYRAWTLDEAVDLCADMLLLCRRASMPVIRLGLQQDPQLENNLLAGPYHPAFGQLVRSRLWRRALLRASIEAQQITINPNDLSDVLGHRGENRDWMKKTCSELSVLSDQSVAQGSLRLSGRDCLLTELSAQGE